MSRAYLVHHELESVVIIIIIIIIIMHELQEKAVNQLIQLQLTLQSRCKAECKVQHVQQGTSCVATQVLHTRSCSGTGMSFVRFLAACYLTFNMDCLTVAKALETLPALPLLHQSTLAPGQKALTIQAYLHHMSRSLVICNDVFCVPVYIYYCNRQLSLEA